MPPVLKTIFLGTPEFAASCLRALVAAEIRPDLVVTQPSKARGRGHKVQPTPVAMAAEEAGLPWQEAENVNSPDSMETLTALKPDLVLVVAFGQLLKQPLLDLPRLAALNVHGSLLPKYRGAAPIQRAIWEGETETGVSIQRMVKKLDAGDVLLAKRLPIGPNMTSGELFEAMAPLGAQALVEAVQLAEQGALEFTPQDPDQVTFAPKLTREEGVMDWTKSAQRVHDQVRALNPWPGARVPFKGRPLKIHRTELAGATSASAGTLETDHRSYLRVACGDGQALNLTRVQQENKKPMGIGDFLKGFQGNFPIESWMQNEQV